MEEYKLSVASSPHASSPVGTKNLMRDVLIALIPALAMGIYVFGPRALTTTLVSVIFCEIFEWGYCKLMHKPNPIGDYSAAITGVLLVFVSPVTLPYWMIIIGDFFAIVIVKQLFGGLGTNFLNPALAGRAFLMLCYPVPMTTWVLPGKENWVSALSVGTAGTDFVTGATPLSVDFMKGGVTPDASLADMFIGNIGGCVGEVSAIALLIGGIYLIARGVIRIRIPAAYILTVAVLTLIFSRAPEGVNSFEWMLREIFAGGLFLGAFFMATDYVTSPNTPKGEVIFGIGAGLLVVFIRYFGGYPEGVCYSILVMNICVWLIDKATMPKRFGVTPEMRKAEKEKAKAAKKAAKEGAEA
ncbi:MAG: RnfABCDGE type electron transport complex subunit D [Evtepia sp.]|uniref:RnfABCDGE type electron transport complex subunit D n=1 Tax=Evtepia sp. TaxID=2773933 RepID=UPI002A75DC56|nr:RnfABCDGE type electron transport complex subunit D [Evtepia sp.]MDY3015043.1 RnfABCDGE type electron transport complex subunit D [Evtepia sp.]